MTLGYKGMKYLGPDGHEWKVIGVALMDGKVCLKLRRTWRPFSKKFRYAVARGGGAIEWVNRGADLVAARMERRRRHDLREGQDISRCQGKTVEMRRCQPKRGGDIQTRVQAAFLARVGRRRQGPPMDRRGNVALPDI